MNYYYVSSDNQVTGPIPEENLHELYRDGTINPDTNIVPEGENDWRAYRSINPVPLPPPIQTLSPVPYAKLRPIPQAQPQQLRTFEATQTCPFCAEQIAPAAKKCKHCGETLDVALRAAEEAKRSHSNQPMVFMNSAAASTAVVSQKRGFPHLIHLVLSFISMGLWIPVWFLLYIFRSRSTYY